MIALTVQLEERFRIELLAVEMVLLLPDLFELILAARMVDLLVVLARLELASVLLLGTLALHGVELGELASSLVLLLHLVGLELLLAHLVHRLEVIGRLLDQLLQVGHLERLRIRVVDVLGHDFGHLIRSHCSHKYTSQHLCI